MREEATTCLTTTVSERLSSFLVDTSVNQRWVLSLSELHTSVYGEHVAGGVLIHFQDADAMMFATLLLTAAERVQWIQQLAQFTEG